jgi:hypothetical protein
LLKGIEEADDILVFLPASSRLQTWTDDKKPALGTDHFEGSQEKLQPLLS